MNTSILSKAILLIAALLVLCGCPSMPVHPLDEPESMAVRGTYVHPASGITMPERVAGFQREGVTRFDVDELDVGGSYNVVMPSHRIAATVYVHPSPPFTSIGSPSDVVASARRMLTEDEFAYNKQEIQEARPGAVLVEEREVSRTERGQRYEGRLAVFEFEGEGAGWRMPMRSCLYLFGYVGGKWTVKYRFTYPMSEDADHVMQEFIENWHWFEEGV